MGRFITAQVNRRYINKDNPLHRLMSQSVKKNLLPAAYFLALYYGTNILVLNAAAQRIIGVALTAFLALMGAIFSTNLVMFFFARYAEKKIREAEDTRDGLALKWLSGGVRLLIWILAVILFLDNIGIKINSLVAGLGIGGVAIAFASQSIIADIFCFFTIFFDRPFEIGDFIKAGEHAGIVEHIGVKTTRLRALSGEQLGFSNTDLTSARLHNYKNMTKRRALFTIGVTYDTPVDKLREIPAIIREIVESTSNTQFGRTHFSSYGNFSLNFEVVYFILSGDYDTYMDVGHTINLRIKEAFDSRGIKFAFPTQTLHIAGREEPVDTNRP
jgi:small-conductance mechanosensitive channel